MKVFFIGTPRGNLDHARLIYRAIEELGYEHTSDFMIRLDPSTFYQAEEAEWRRRYSARLREIAKGEICIFEVSIHSLAIGQLIQEAIRHEKPVIALYYQGQRPYFLRGTEGSETRAQLVEYTPDNVKEVLSDALDIASELLTTRFTMLMQPEMTKFLDLVVEEKGISRSEYIRDLIARDMQKGMK